MALGFCGKFLFRVSFSAKEDPEISNLVDKLVLAEQSKERKERKTKWDVAVLAKIPITWDLEVFRGPPYTQGNSYLENCVKECLLYSETVTTECYAFIGELDDRACEMQTTMRNILHNLHNKLTKHWEECVLPKFPESIVW